LETSRTTDVNFGPKTGLDDLHVDVVIHTERAPHTFSKHMQRHQMFDVYMEVPQHSIRLKEVKDLFYLNDDTKGKSPRKILAVGRPGIGKTVLTQKIRRDWAKGDEQFYRGKIVFYFKFRWFDSNELKNIILKAFLRYGTGLSDEQFEGIYKDITDHPEKAILIFDGLDEFPYDDDCLNQLPPRSDPNFPMSGISLFITLIAGRLLPKATVLVTSRPTAIKFYSRLTFDRTVEILGFNSDKIEKYVSKFCGNKSRPDLKHKIWNHIKSSSDLLNLCYIPVNCWIVTTILFKCVTDPGNVTGAIPTTVTELYEEAITYFDEHHNRKLSGQSSEKAIKRMMELAYNGIELREIVFKKESIDEEMSNSGLLNSLPSHINITRQFCFTHLTVQEFLAARHVTETFTPEKIKEFILSHIESGKWHLVLQFIAGLLGKKNDYKYKNCVLAFAESFVCKDVVILDDDDNSALFVIKCLREAEDENIAKQACETAMNDVVSLATNFESYLTPSDWAAVTFVCKHMKKLTRLHFVLSDLTCDLEVNELLQQRCIKELQVMGFTGDGCEGRHLFQALRSQNCSLKHEHVKLTELTINCFRVTDEENSSKMCEFFKNGCASCLEKLSLGDCEISSREVSILCEVLDNKLCPELTYLDLSGNSILDEGVEVLCNALTEQKLFTLSELDLYDCSLTDKCMPSLCKLLTDERCELTLLDLPANEGISDEGLDKLCRSALTTEHCKLMELNVAGCSLTDNCIPELCKALQHENCDLVVLSLSSNRSLTDNGLSQLCDALQHKNCDLKELKLNECSLTDNCIPELCNALRHANCTLEVLCLLGNTITEERMEYLETHVSCALQK
jgi:Ran GTPase-activating protein (RanGAP) involved in mRNA processing and transport